MKRDRVLFKFLGLHIEGEGKPAMTVAYIGAAALVILVGWRGLEFLAQVADRIPH